MRGQCAVSAVTRRDTSTPSPQATGNTTAFSASDFHLQQHADERGPKRPILLAVDQELGEGAAIWVAPELSDPVGSLEVREHQDMEQLGAGSRAESAQPGAEVSFEVSRLMDLL